MTTSTSTTLPNQPPVADAGPDQIGTINVSLTLDGSRSVDPDGTITTWWWQFGDGGSGTFFTPTVTHTYTATGTFTATLWVRDDAGTWSKAAATAVETIGTATTTTGATTTSTSSTTTSTTSSSTTSTTSAPATTSTSSTTTTKPSTTSTSTSSSTTTSTSTTSSSSTTLAGGNQAPTANAGPDQFTQTLVSIVFSGSGSSDPDGTIASYAWSFGDGTTGTGVLVTHTYATAGSYTVRLTVTDDKGATGSDTATVTVANRAPTADAGPDRTVVEDTTVTFDGSGSSDLDGSIVRYDWYFGDGGTGTGVSASHVYPAPGTFTVMLTVTDNNGASNSDTAVVTVNAAGGPGWATSIGSTDVDLGTAVGSDANGNRFVAGTFHGTVKVGTTSLASAGGADAFLAKYTPTGTVAWARRMGGTLDDTVTALAVDGNGDVITVGRFQGTTNFGGTNLVSSGGIDIVVAKYSGSTGAHLWSKRFGDASDQSAEAVAVDPSGNVLLTGFFAGTVNFGGATLQTPYVGDYDVFVAKLTSAGAHVWSENFPNTGNDFGTGIATDGAGNVAVVGYFNATIDFGGGTFLAANAYTDAFLVKLTSGGAHLWSKQLGADDGGDTGQAVAMDATGDIVVAGQSDHAIDLGGGFLTALGGVDVWVAEYNPAGAHIWSRRIGGGSTDEVSGVRIDGNGNVLVEGDFRWTAAFGGTSLTSAGAEDVYVAKYTATGAPVWAQQLGGLGSDYGNALAVTPAGDPLIAGTFYGSGSFGGILLTSSGLGDAFLARLLP